MVKYTVARYVPNAYLFERGRQRHTSQCKNTNLKKNDGWIQLEIDETNIELEASNYV